MKRFFIRFAFLILVLCGVSKLSLASLSHAEAPKAREKWTTNRLLGTPEPPPALRPERVFPKLQFDNPLHLELNKVQNRWYVLQQSGKILTFPNDPAAASTDVAIDFAKDLKSWKPDADTDRLDAVYGLTFHPKFAENRYCYVCYVLKGKKGELPDGSRVSRFKVSDTNPPKFDPSSEEVLLTFLAGGHNGGCLVFGPDGFLYISTGDAASPNPPDVHNTGQDCSDLLSSILRIDVDHLDAGKKYSIPKDNPFVGREGIRPEIWAFGFRNPWKMSFDRTGGTLWAGDVGWEMYEMVHKIVRGGNYGWSIKEGPQNVRPDVKIGPTPILPPMIAFPHTEAASITGGYVYRGKKWKDLVGAYVCGDWVSRKFWATRFEGDTMTSHQEIASSQHQIVSFAEDADGELVYLDYGPQGGIYTLVPNEEASKPQPAFPRKLSETGIWSNVSGNVTSPGVASYEVNTAPWADHAHTSRVVGLPGDSTASIFRQPQKVPGTAWFNSRVFFPKNGILAKTFSLDFEAGNPATRRRIETQVMHYDGQEWRGYTYKWNEAQTDAELVPATGEDIDLTVKDPATPGGIRKQTWHFSGRSECRQCHNPWAGVVLGFTESQLKGAPSSEKKNNSWERLLGQGFIVRGDGEAKPTEAVALLADKLDSLAKTDDKARSYLQANCAHCHQFGAGGSVDIDLRMEMALEQTKAIDAKPVQGTFDIPGAQIIAAGDPYRSVLYYRISKQGRGRMPHIGSELVDVQGVRVIRDWIRQLPGRRDDRALIDQCVKNEDTPERKEAIAKLLSSPATALLLAEAWEEKPLPESSRSQILAAATLKEAPIRDLFERYVPESQRVNRLGTIIRPESLLAVKGDAARGKDLFFNKNLSQCAQCHKAGAQGGEIGPDLSQIGKKLQKRQLLESITDPSKDIDPKFASHTAELDDGRLLAGLVVRQSPTEVVIRDIQGKDTIIPIKKLGSLTPSKKSLMPEQLLRDMTAQQAADLLAYLESLK